MLTRVWIRSPNYYTPRGATVRLIVLHTAEGARTYQALGNYFANPTSVVSSHVGIDDTTNTVGEYVKRDNAAWTASNANPVAVQGEMCAFAAWTTDQWMTHPVMLTNCARWIAEEAAAFGIPIVKLSPADAQGSGRGVCQHSDLGVWGGSHHDCGPGFPIDYVLELARAGIGDDMVLLDPTSGGYWCADESGALFAYDGAPYLGGCNNPRYNANGWPCSGIAAYRDAHGDGYCLVLDAGATPGDRFRRYRFPRDGSARV